MYKTEEIKDVYVILEEFNYYAMKEKVEFGMFVRSNQAESKFTEPIYKNLQWVISNGLTDRINLGPNESGDVLLVRDIDKPDRLEFALGGPKSDLDNDWIRDGIYELYVSVYGKVANQDFYQKKVFLVELVFRKGVDTSIQWANGIDDIAPKAKPN